MEHCIEIATRKGATPKEIGDLLEQIATTALKAQGFEVTQQVRLVASEVDLLCRHRVSRERVYVECKAYRDTMVTGSQLRQLLGTVQFEKFSAGWLFSTGPLSKDAKGFIETWKERPEPERRTLRIYEPEQFIQLLIAVSIIIDTTKIPFNNSSLGRNIKKWMLLLTSFGNYWIALMEQPGIPMYAFCFDAYDGTPVSDAALSQIKETNTSVNLFELKSAPKVFSSYEAYTTSQKTVTTGDLFIDPSIEEFISKIRQLPNVRLFAFQPVEKFGRKGFAITLELDKIGLYSAIGSDIQGAIGSLSRSIPLPESVKEILSEISEASAPRDMLSSILNFYEPRKTYLAWADFYDGNLEDIIPVKLAAQLNEEQAIKSTIIIAAELLSLRVIAEETDEYEHAIRVEDEAGNQWIGEIDLKSSNPIVTEVRYLGKNDNHV